MEEVDVDPTNEGEISDYSFSLKSEMAIPEGSSLEFLFPDQFDPLLTTYDKTIRVVLVK